MVTCVLMFNANANRHLGLHDLLKCALVCLSWLSTKLVALGITAEIHNRRDSFEGFESEFFTSLPPTFPRITSLLIIGCNDIYEAWAL